MQLQQLEPLMTAYFHEDWDARGLWETLDHYMADSTDADITQLHQDLTDVTRTMDEAQVTALLRSYYASVDMTGSPGGNRGWVEAMTQRVAARL